MKFSIAAIAGLASAVTASLPAAFTLVADGGYTVLTDGQNLWVGANATTHPIAILRSGSNGAITYTSQSAPPTAWQNLYIIPNEVSPPALTVPHSGATPRGANETAFGVTKDGLFAHDGKAWFATDGLHYSLQDPKEIFWYGAHNAEYGSINLYVKECKGC
ncbi:hypothetical protein N7456_001188 [Penicillium angulare]|uniref:Uncharacterized protein n=1 Tax=Penicillium angulare TaxID=116970 RepID=A0A9W9KSU3_9EURO|nr:hypothetical protein N7456_001188 [Penicillium angulare]